MIAAGASGSLPAVAARDDLALVSRASGSLGQGGDLASSEPSISADGRAVAFASFARNFSTADADDVSDVFVRDTLTAATTLVSRGPGVNGAGGDGFSSAPAISADGRAVAFTSTADNLSNADGPAADVFVRDTATGATSLVSRASGSLGAGGDGASSAPATSGDGRFVAFSSSAGNLSAADGPSTDVFVRDTAANQTILVSRGPGPNGPGGDAASSAPAISADGRFVAFSSSARNLSGEDDDTVPDIFLRDTVTGATTLVSRAPGAGGFPGDGASLAPAISADGRLVAFMSSADNLSNEDDDGADGLDIFVRDTVAGTTTLASRATGAGGAGGDGASEAAAISRDGRFVAFESAADNLSAVDAAAVSDIFVRDLVAGTTTLVSRAPGANGFAGDGSSSAPVIAQDGRVVAFQSDAANLSAEDGSFTDVFARDVLGPPEPARPPPGTGVGTDPPAPAPLTPLTLTRSSLAGRYTPRGLRATLVLRGTVLSAGTFEIRLRHTRGPRTVGLRTSVALRLRLTAAGPFVSRLRLPRTLAPGRYSLIAAGRAVPRREAGVITIPPPRLGLVHRVFASGVRGGPPALVLPRGTRIVYCNVRFAILPARGPITTEWSAGRRRSERTVRPRAFRLAAFVRGPSGGSLTAGRYTCTVRVRGQRLAAASVHVR